MKDTDLHQNRVWTELHDFFLEQLDVFFFLGRNPMRILLDSEGSWMSEAAASLFGRESVSLEPIPGQAHWQTGLVEEAVRGLKATMAQLPAPTPEKMSEGYSPLQHALGRAPDLDGRFSHTRIRGISHSTSGTCGYETYGNNIKRMQDSEVNFLRWTYRKRVSRALNSKNSKALVFLPGIYVYCWRKDKR